MLPDEPSKTIAVTGANSFIGKHLVSSLSLDPDQRVIALTSDASRASISAAKNVSLFQGDLLSSGTLAGFIPSGSVVINLAYLREASQDENLKAMSNLLERCEDGGISRFIHCSTAVVVGRTSADTVTESTPCAPVDEYEHTKLLLEKMVLQRSSGKFESLIIRPTAVFGAGGKNLVKTIDELCSGSALVDYLRSCVYYGRSMNLVCVENVVAAIEHLIHMEMTQEKVFIISDDDDSLNNYTEIRELVMQHLGKGRGVPSIPMPPFVLGLLLKVAGRSNVNPYLRYSSSRLAGCGYRKRVTLADGLDAFIAGELGSICQGARL